MFDSTVQAIAAHLPRFDLVTSGTFSSPQPVPRVYALGPAPRAGIVLVPDRAGTIVEMINLVLDGAKEDGASIIQALRSVPSPRRSSSSIGVTSL